MQDLFFHIQKKHWLFLKLCVVSVTIILSLTACGETKDAATLISEATEYHKKGDDNAAIIQLKNAIQQEPNNVQARFLLGTIYHKNNDLLSAEKELNRAYDLGMDADQILPVLYQVLFDLGKYQHLHDLIEQDAETDSEELQILHAQVLMALQKSDEAKEILDRLVVQNPASPDVLIGLAQYAVNAKDTVLAGQYVDQAIEKNMQNLNAWAFKANLLRAQGEHEEALVAFEKILQLSPENIGAYHSKAAIEIGLGQFDNAEKSIENARKIEPDSIMLHYSQALLDFSRGKNDEALNSIQTVLSAAPENLPGNLLAGAIQLSLGSFLQAEQYLEKYLKNIPGNLFARKLMINTLLKSNKAQQAIEHLEAVLPVAQQDPQLLALAGEAYMKSGDFTKAINLYEKANEMVPNNAMLHTALGMTRLAMGDSEQGITELKQAADLEQGSPRAGILLVLAHFRANEFDKALSAIDELEKEDSQNPLFHNLRGVAYMGLKDYAKARNSLKEALAIQTDFFPAIANLARLDVLDQKPETAKSRFVALLKKDDKNIQAMNALAALALSQNNADEATRWLELSRDKNPNALEPALHLAAHYSNLREHEQALLLTRKLFGTYPNEPRVLEMLGNIQFGQRNYAAALDSYEKLAAQMPDSFAAQMKIAEVHALMKNTDSAATALKKALFINPDYVQAKAAQVRLALLDENEAEALSLVKKMQQAHADIPDGYALEGDIFMQQKNPMAAVAAYEKAFSIGKTSTLAIKIHTALNQAGDAQKAQSHLTQWLSDHPNDSAVRIYLADVYLAKNDKQNAQKQYEAILEYDPKQVTSLNNLAWLYHLNDDARAFEYAQKAYEIAPGSAAIQDTLGWILAKNGETERALQLLEGAAATQPDNATIQFHYAHTLAKAGNQTNALQILDKILASDTGFPEIDEARALLNQLR